MIADKTSTSELFRKAGVLQDAISSVGIHDACGNDDVSFRSGAKPNLVGTFCLTHEVAAVFFQQLTKLLIDRSTHSGCGSLAFDAEIKRRCRSCIP